MTITDQPLHAMSPQLETLNDRLMQNVTVLVVDDSPDALSLINDILEQNRVNALVALEGKQALSIAKKMRPDMILMDAIMPNMSGFDACKQIKEDPLLASIPVIFMTGLTDTESVVKGLEAGGVDYLTKPINPIELLARMKVHLTNARRTNTVQQALSATGQTLFSIDDKGTILWATPQTYALLAKAGADMNWQQGALAEQLKQYLANSPLMLKNTDTLPLCGIDYPLECQWIERTHQETFLKLIDAKRDADDVLLQKSLAITEREAEVLLWVAHGKTNREIGEILSVRPRTVNKHLEQMFPKLGVENRTSAAAMALKVLN
jgi:DNA-binding NarL/FixJ family response regulator